jgi:prepilin-type N-terminal cleavage/methylation domain-containing protein
VIRRLARHVRGQRGYTLIELVAVLAIFLMIVTALVSLFTSGAKAELDLNRRFEAQQNARLALDKIRRELHCSDGVTATPNVAVTSISVSMPAQCPAAQGVATTIVYDTVSLGSSRWQLRRTKDGVSIPIADYIVSTSAVPNGAVFTYSPQTATTRALLHVDLPVNVYPNEGWKQWRLVDDIVLRNTLREDL